MVLMVFLSSRISPFTSTVILRDKSPRATAVVTSAMLRTCAVRLLAMELTLSVRSFQVPATPGTWPGRPASVGAHLTRHARHLPGEGVELVHHGVDGLLELEDFAAHVHGDLLGEVAVGDGRGHLGDVAHLPGEVAGHRVDAIGQVLPRAAHAGTWAWPPSLPSVPTSRATRVTSEAKDELIHHGIDGVLQLEDFAAHVHGDLARQVATRHRRGHLGDVAHLRRQVAGHGS